MRRVAANRLFLQTTERPHDKNGADLGIRFPRFDFVA
jgi:hypothetical protein